MIQIDYDSCPVFLIKFQQTQGLGDGLLVLKKNMCIVSFFPQDYLTASKSLKLFFQRNVPIAANSVTKFGFPSYIIKVVTQVPSTVSALQ